MALSNDEIVKSDDGELRAPNLPEDPRLARFARDPRRTEFTVQLRACDAAKAGSSLAVPALLALCSAQLEKSLRLRLAASRSDA